MIGIKDYSVHVYQMPCAKNQSRLAFTVVKIKGKVHLIVLLQLSIGSNNGATPRLSGVLKRKNAYPPRRVIAS
jgi:hypothetical protein